MKEQKAILKAYYKIKDQRQSALATVVRVRGSSYRSPGARMLITDDGHWTGSISGGCLEGDALRKARQVMNKKEPLTVTYDTREKSNQNLGIGLGCNGVIDVLIEPVIREQQANPVLIFEKLVACKAPVAMATIFSGIGVGEKMMITADGAVENYIQEADLANQLRHDLMLLFETCKSEAKRYSLQEKEYDVFLELMQPTVSLIIFGGGFDARPVSALAASLGWEVIVTDECVAHIAPIFFPTAGKLSLCQREFIDRDFEVTPYTACVLMSHNYEYDRDVIRKLIRTSTPYIGILGPRKRFEKMLAEFDGVTLSADDYHRIHSPIGLDIGAETPDEIALSIIAEIQSKFTNRSGGFLRYIQGPIHQRDQATDQVFKQVYLAQSVSKANG